MARGKQYIGFEGLFAEGVLGIFRIIRGYADLRDLAAVSVPYKMEAGPAGVGVVGHQRPESEKHAEDIKKYLEQSENRFLPKVILSVRSPMQLVTADGEISPDKLAGLGVTVYGATSRAVIERFLRHVSNNAEAIVTSRAKAKFKERVSS